MAYKEEPYIFIDTNYKVFILFYMDNIQVIYHKSNKALTQKIILGIKDTYKLRDLGDIKWFLRV